MLGGKEDFHLFPSVSTRFSHVSHLFPLDSDFSITHFCREITFLLFYFLYFFYHAAHSFICISTARIANVKFGCMNEESFIIILLLNVIIFILFFTKIFPNHGKIISGTKDI